MATERISEWILTVEYADVSKMTYTCSSLEDGEASVTKITEAMRVPGTVVSLGSHSSIRTDLVRAVYLIERRAIMAETKAGEHVSLFDAIFGKDRR